LMGTDYPYDMAESDPIAHLVSAELDGAVIAAIAGGNVRRLLKL
jgi:aminocarboxymuconate-semialdehyde decarboxylase